MNNNITINTYPTEKFTNKSIIIEKCFSKDLINIREDYAKYLDCVVVSSGQICDRIEKMAIDMNEKYQEKSIHFLVLLKGALHFANILQNNLDKLKEKNICKFDYSFDQIAISSYSGTQSTGEIKINSDIKVLENLKGKNVVILEDIYDTGKSLHLFLDYIKKFA
jgi:hypoxanthine phosphoribosyltransferase